MSNVGAGFMRKTRARDLGIPFDGAPGPLNSITDVKGVEVGHSALISGEGELKVGLGRARFNQTQKGDLKRSRMTRVPPLNDPFHMPSR